VNEPPTKLEFVKSTVEELLVEHDRLTQARLDKIETKLDKFIELLKQLGVR
jgi:coenzyme F420-reducing hydrogenase delta subunit